MGHDGEHLLIPEGTFAGLALHPAYKAKKEADEPSYAWDRLIEQFSNNLLAGTSVHVFGEQIDVSKAEEALRSLALEPRIQRRLLAESLVGALVEAEEQAVDRFTRVALPGPHSPDRTVAYVFLILAYPKITLKDGYEQYRRVRTNMLHAYCLHTLFKNRQLKRAVGLGFDASSKVTGRKGGSEDLIALEVHDWTPETEKQAEELQTKFDIMQPERIVVGGTSTDEFPVPCGPTKTAKERREVRKKVTRQNNTVKAALRKQDREWREKQKRLPPS